MPQSRRRHWICFPQDFFSLIRSNRVDSLLEIEAVVLAGIDAPAVLGVRIVPLVGGKVLDVDDLRNGEAVLQRERQIRSSCAGTPITAPSPYEIST